METFTTPAEALDWLRDKPIGTECTLVGPRTDNQKNNLYRAARRKGFRVGFLEKENADCLLTKTKYLGDDYGRELSRKDNYREIRKTHSLKPEGPHERSLSELRGVTVGEMLKFTQNEKDILREAKKYGIRVSIHRCDDCREVTRVQ